MTRHAHITAAAMIALVAGLSPAALARISPYTSVATFTAAAVNKGHTVKSNNFDALPEGEITAGAGSSSGMGTSSLLSDIGISTSYGENPWVDYFGTPSTTTRLFVDDPVTANTWGNVHFNSANPDVITDHRVLRPVTVGAGNVPLQEGGGLATGRIHFIPGAGIESFALSLIDVDRTNTHLVFWTGPQANPANAVSYTVPAGADNATQFLGFVFDKPLVLIEVWAGDFNSADGVTIGSIYAGTVPAPGYVGMAWTAGMTMLRRKRRN